MPDENLLATLEQNLRQTRATRARMASRLIDLEREAEKVRGELAEIDAIASQTEAAIFRLLSSMLGASTNMPATVPDSELESAMRADAMRTGGPIYPSSLPPVAPPIRTDLEVRNNRFTDRTIPQATTMLLREASGPLHVNEIYNRLVEGGFNFTGHNPTISIAVSLNRNRRFRKVAPGTFDLVMRDAAQAS